MIARTSSSRPAIASEGRTAAASCVHRVEEVLVGLAVLQLVQQELLAGAALGDVDRREGALVGELAVEDQLRVAGALELLEDHLVHARTRVDQRRGDDGERAALLDVARGAEEALRPL